MCSDLSTENLTVAAGTRRMAWELNGCGINQAAAFIMQWCQWKWEKRMGRLDTFHTQEIKLGGLACDRGESRG